MSDSRNPDYPEKNEASDYDPSQNGESKESPLNPEKESDENEPGEETPSESETENEDSPLDPENELDENEPGKETPLESEKESEESPLNPEKEPDENEPGKETSLESETGQEASKVEEKEQIPSPAELKHSIPLASPPIMRELYFTAGILLLLFSGLLIWAAFAPLESISIAQGVVTVASGNKLIQHNQGGTLKRVYVKESEQVKAGQPLILLDDPSVESKLSALNKSKYFYEAKMARLQAALQDSNEISFPKDITERASQTDIKKLMEAEANLFDQGRKGHQAEIDILKKQIQELEQEQSQSEANYNAMEAQKTFLEEEINAVTFLLSKQLALKPRLLALQRERARVDGEALKSLSELARIEHQKDEIAAKIIGSTNEWNRKNLSELEDAEQHLLELAPQLIAAQDMADKLVIKAPINGIVKGLKYKSAGEVIRPAEVIMEIVPSGEKLVVEAQLDPNDVKEVFPGLKAKVTINAFSFRYTPNFYGKVQYVSPDAFVNEKDGRRYYLVRVWDFDETWQGLENEKKLTPGMPAEVMIINDQRTALYYILSPLWQSFNRAFGEKL